MGWPQITLAILYGLSWLAILCLHGKPRTGKYDIGMFTATLGLVLWLQWCGGFWGRH